MASLTPTSLMHSRPGRVDLARQRFFEEGQSPTGVVGEVIFESWARCLRLHGNPRESAIFEPVTPSRTQLALLKNRLLRQAWMDELPRLDSILSTTSCAAMLTDPSGVLIGSSCVGRSHEALMPVATRLGVNLSEEAVGTTAPGVAARTGKAVCVMGGEHFFDSVKAMHCAAAPIRDIHGGLAGVLDISSEALPFEFDAASIAGLYASAMENRLLVAQSCDHLVIRFQVAPELIDSAMVGLLGVDGKGDWAWANGVARRLLGVDQAGAGLGGKSTDESLGFSWARLASLPSRGAEPLLLPNGLHVWARAQMQAPDGRRGLVSSAISVEAQIRAMPEPPSFDPAIVMPTPPTTPSADPSPVRLRESDLELIQRTLTLCGGNVSETAARLGVSRGLIYRRLRAGVKPAESEPEPS